MRQTIINRTVFLLGAVSLLTDIASEMLYPVMPLYLESIGFSVAGIGVLEGVTSAWISRLVPLRETGTALLTLLVAAYINFLSSATTPPSGTP